jgi:pentatricopeptide repeat protein
VSGGLLEKDVVLGTSLVDMYVKCGMLEKAQMVLKDLHIRNVTSWNALIAGYAQQGQGNEALTCFEYMQSKGALSPDVVTYTCALKACGGVGAIDKGKQIHDEILFRKFLEKDTTLGNALVDMYAKCGALAKAQEVLEELPIRNVISWNALISGYAQGGQGLESLNCFQCMQSDGLAPDEVTFQCVLRACTHAGLFDEVQLMFADMVRNNIVIPSIEHHRCVLVVLGTAGYFDEVLFLTKVMPSLDHPTVWLAVLNACKKWGNTKLAGFAFNRIA